MFGIQQVAVPAAVYVILLAGLIYLALAQAVISCMTVYEKLRKKRVSED